MVKRYILLKKGSSIRCFIFAPTTYQASNANQRDDAGDHSPYLRTGPQFYPPSARTTQTSDERDQRAFILLCIDRFLCWGKRAMRVYRRVYFVSNIRESFAESAHSIAYGLSSNVCKFDSFIPSEATSCPYNLYMPIFKC